MFARFQTRDPDPTTEPRYTDPYTLLVAVVLSAQATDKSVNRATPALSAAAGAPEKMGEYAGWSEAKFIEASKTQSPDGRSYQNLCIGCDRFHQEVLGKVLDERYRARRGKRMGILARSEPAEKLAAAGAKSSS